MATSIDDNKADEKSDKPRCQLINIRCTSLAERQFYKEDVVTALNYDNVKVYDISRMSEKQFRNLLNSSDVNICAWCFSERSNDIINVFK